MSWLQSLPQRYRVASDPLRSERRIELLVVGLAALLALVLVYGVLRLSLLSAPATVMPAADSLEVGSIAPRFRPEPADSDEIRSRPLFWAGRRPVDPAEQVAVEPEKTKSSQGLKGVKLVGVFGVGDSAGIIIQGKKGKQRLLVGEEVDGWTLNSIGPNEVSLSAAGESRTLVLKQQAIAARPEQDTVVTGQAEEPAPVKQTHKPATQAKRKNTARQSDDDSLSLGGSIRRPK